jgi:hypothetical protein
MTLGFVAIKNPGKGRETMCHDNLSCKQLLGFWSAMKPNGPAIKGGCGTWRSHPVTYPGTLAVIYPGGKPGMACFLQIQA